MRAATSFAAALVACVGAAEAHAKGVRLGELTWVDAKDVLASDPVVVLPLGAGAKEHGPHLPLETDLVQAEHLAARLLADAKRDAAMNVVITPALAYGFYPAFVEYPGSTHVTEGVARDVVIDIVRSIAKHGPRRFYVLNVGISTNKPLSQAKAVLALEGIALSYLDYGADDVHAAIESVRTQSEGTHADELETSMMLAIDPRRVDMRKATKDVGAGKAPRGAFTPDANGARPSPSGIYGDATIATKQKGRKLVDAFASAIAKQVRALAASKPPDPANVYGKMVQPAPAPSAPAAK